MAKGGRDEEACKRANGRCCSRRVHGSSCRRPGRPDTRRGEVYRCGRLGWAWEAIAWAADEGIMCGIAPDLFNPSGRLTRAQQAVILYRYAHPEARAECPTPSPPTTIPAGVSGWEDTTWYAGDGTRYAEATLYAIDQPREAGWLEATCYESGNSYLSIGKGWAIPNNVDWAEVERNEDIEYVAFVWVRWALVSDDNILGDWSHDFDRLLFIPFRDSSGATITRQMYARLLAADQLIVEGYGDTIERDRGWRPDAYPLRATFDLTGDDTSLRTVLADCFPPTGP